MLIMRFVKSDVANTTPVNFWLPKLTNSATKDWLKFMWLIAVLSTLISGLKPKTLKLNARISTQPVFTIFPIEKLKCISFVACAKCVCTVLVTVFIVVQWWPVFVINVCYLPYYRNNLKSRKIQLKEISINL